MLRLFHISVSELISNDLLIVCMSAYVCMSVSVCCVRACLHACTSVHEFNLSHYDIIYSLGILVLWPCTFCVSELVSMPF